MYKKVFLITLFALPVCVCLSSEPSKPKSIIFLIGDGMGLTQISYGILSQTNTSNFERFTAIGFSKTESYSSKITDSAAGATAFSIGEKTYNGAIGVDANKQPKKTILELAEQKNLSTGLVATCAITHATPAAFIAHQPHRKMYEDIAKDFLATDIDIFIGGGLKYFNKRKDSLNLCSSLQQKGYKVYTSEKELFSDNFKGKTAALLAEEHLPKVQEGRGDFGVKSISKALEVLSQNPNGFFLMAEGSQIDWGGHSNDAEYIKQEVQDFDKVIGVALEFAKTHPETLIIVTADHETGGFALTADSKTKDENYGEFAPAFTSKHHSGTMVPVFAFGPGASEFTGIYHNTEIFNKMKRLLGL